MGFESLALHRAVRAEWVGLYDVSPHSTATRRRERHTVGVGTIELLNSFRGVFFGLIRHESSSHRPASLVIAELQPGDRANAAEEFLHIISYRALFVGPSETYIKVVLGQIVVYVVDTKLGSYDIPCRW